MINKASPVVAPRLYARWEGPSDSGELRWGRPRRPRRMPPNSLGRILGPFEPTSSSNPETAAVACGYVRPMIGRAARVAQRDAERGATMLEYALVATFIAVVVSAALVVFGPAVANLFTGATAAL